MDPEHTLQSYVEGDVKLAEGWRIVSRTFHTETH
jgi:hypothetical protein